MWRLPSQRLASVRRSGQGAAVLARRIVGATYDPEPVAISDKSSAAERIGEYLERFVERCKAEHAVHGVLQLGSAVDPGAVDALSDLDLMVITTSPRRLSSPAWLESVDPSAFFSWTYQSPIGGQRIGQAIYDGPLVVDLAFVSSFQAFLLGTAVSGLSRRPALRRRVPLWALSQIGAWLAIVDRGTKVLFDRAGLARRIATSTAQSTREPPAEEVYLNTVYSALGLLLWESKQLVRGELWMGLETVDYQVKQCLLTMMEWHSLAVNPELGDTWYGGRHIEDWADHRWLPPLRQARSRFDLAEAWDALFVTLGLFSDVASETGRLLGYNYPSGDELRVRGWIEARQGASRGD
jgi:aminoglycoside 6-adenylyltransferase